MTLRRQGFYKEMPHGDESDPSIYEFIDKNEKSEIDNICKYLKGGRVLVSCGGITQDVINPQNGSAGCPDMLTDGIWLWPGDLAYYVKQYYLKLDDEFIQTMRDNHWYIKDDIDIDFVNIEVI